MAAKKRSCAQGKSRRNKRKTAIVRDSRGRFAPGYSGNPSGSTGKSKRIELEAALERAATGIGVTFLDRIAVWAFADRTMAMAVLDKLIPDLRSIEGDMTHTLNLAQAITDALKN